MHTVEALEKTQAFADLAGYTKVFDPFEVMGVRSKELVHSRILASFLNKQEHHGLGAEFLNTFISRLARPDAVVFAGNRLDREILLMATEPNAQSRIYREFEFIDIVIVFPAHQLVIGIENKIRAGEQQDQLARYQKTLSTYFSGYRQALVFLTRSGRAPETANPEHPVPVYCMTYGEIAVMLKQCKASSKLDPAAAIFIDQFIGHIERYMTGSAQTKELCWQLFSNHENAYRKIVDHYLYCIKRKVILAFSSIAERLATDPIFCTDSSELQIRHYEPKDHNKEVVHCDLDFRLKSWPEGVWIKIYKHTWFAVFPFIHEADLANLGSDCPLSISHRDARSWQGYRYVTTRQDLDDGRKVRANGNELTEDDINVALGLVAGYIREINESLCGCRT